ncbi:MAG TPA: hypothetical protein VFR75_03805 [Solirubrobacterales bacterium]|nr:hypothetical protein [Solirubrobacterales bacterium]
MAETEEKPKEEKDPRWQEFKKRCDAAGLNYKYVGGTTLPVAVLQIPEEGSDRPQLLVWGKGLTEVLEIDFEKYKLVGGYYGICCEGDRSVEAFLEPALITAPVKKVFERAELTLPMKLESNGVAIEVGPPSKELIALVGGSEEVRGIEGTAIRISGVDIDGGGKPKAVLERYANALLFQFDTKVQQPLVLSRRQPVRLPFPLAAASNSSDLVFPPSEFDHEPMALYWYGRGAHGMPLLEFFAYYQVLEFYYEHYVDAEGRRRISQVLKDPGFSPHDDRFVSRVLRAAGRGSGNRRTERDQLLTTIRGCADAAEIRNYIDEDENRKKFFAEKDPKLTEKTLNLSTSDTELLQQLADRIYDLRCKIVHTKEGGTGSGVELLLPHSQEAERLKSDIELLRIIARQAISAAGRPII